MRISLKRFYYLIQIEYLGYRFHGWQKQPRLKTVHLMLDKTLNFVLEGQSFKSLGSGRTDAMVSANEGAFELFLSEPIPDKDAFLKEFNYNLPQDIRALSITEVDKNFNIIQHSKLKEYVYIFGFGAKFHPFCAPFMTTIQDDLDIELMKKGALLFEGTHNFKPYCYKATDMGVYTRTITECKISKNTLISANFMPKTSYMLTVKGEGFMRNQIRLMMGTLFNLGQGKTSLEAIQDSLKPNSTVVMSFIAPASGLILNKQKFYDVRD